MGGLITGTEVVQDGQLTDYAVFMGGLITGTEVLLGGQLTDYAVFMGGLVTETALTSWHVVVIPTTKAVRK